MDLFPLTRTQALMKDTSSPDSLRPEKVTLLSNRALVHLKVSE